MRHLRPIARMRPAGAQIGDGSFQSIARWVTAVLDVLIVLTRVFGPKIL